MSTYLDPNDSEGGEQGAGAYWNGSGAIREISFLEVLVIVNKERKLFLTFVVKCPVYNNLMCISLLMIYFCFRFMVSTNFVTV